MKPGTKCICWIDSQKNKKVLDPQVQALQGVGFQITWIEPCDPSAMNSADWILKSLPETTELVVWGHNSVETLKPWIPVLRALPNSPLNTVPVVWIPDAGKASSLAEVIECGVSDVLSLLDEPACFAARILLHIKARGEGEAIRQKLKNQAIDIARNETIVKQREEFLSVCAHDLRAPLGLIKTSLSMVLAQDAKKSALDSMQVELLTRAQKQAGHAITLVSDLLDVMAYEQGLKPQYQLFSLHELLLEFYKDCQIQAEQKAILLHYENPVKDWRILADPERVRQLFQNLLTNAIKFTEKSKNIYLTVMPFQGRRKTDPPYPMVIISVKDEGRGIPDRERQKIFDRFAQIKEYSRAEGRGLGLTVAKQISTLHDGNIWVQSAEGKGSTFFVLFPHVISGSKAKETVKKATRILVAESSLDRREAYFDQIQDWGYELIYAKDGAHAAALTFYDPPDVLLLADGLSKMDAVEVVTVLKQEPAIEKLPVVLAKEPSTEPNASFPVDQFDFMISLPLAEDSFRQVISQALEKSAEKSKKAA